MNCADCKHNEHAPGQCRRCNCGESYIVRGTFQECLEWFGGALYTTKREKGGLDVREESFDTGWPIENY